MVCCATIYTQYRLPIPVLCDLPTNIKIEYFTYIENLICRGDTFYFRRANTYKGPIPDSSDIDIVAFLLLRNSPTSLFNTVAIYPHIKGVDYLCSGNG